MKNNQLQKLVIDSETCINYKKSDISSNHIFLTEIEDLIELFNEDNDNLFGFDTTKCFSIITFTGEEIPFNKYDSKEDIIRFFKISNSVLREIDSELYVPFDYICLGRGIESMVLWQTEHILIDSKLPNYTIYKDEKDRYEKIINQAINYKINGYANSVEMLNIAQDIKKYGSMQALLYSLNQSVKIAGNIWQGYLPSLYQLNLMYKCVHMLEYFCRKFDFPLKIRTKKYGWWTSNEFDNKHIFTLEPDGRIGGYVKDTSRHKLPFFKKINKTEYIDIKYLIENLKK